jgi:5-methylcytosine-specific restriction endonuclease McrA
MLSMSDYKKKVATLYSNDRARWRKVLEKGAPKGVKLDIPAAEVLPYTQAQFGKWLWSQIQLQVILCPYCHAPIDILSMELDHKVPLRRGGDMSFENRECICRRCNQCKGELTADEFRLLVTFMEKEGAHFRQRLEGTLINGGVGKMMRHFAKGKKHDPTKVQPSLAFAGMAELGEF